MPKLSGGNVVALVLGLAFMMLGTPIVLVALGQPLSAIVAAGTAIISGLAGIFGWLYVLAQKMNRVEQNTNGNLHTKDADNKVLSQQLVTLAALLPPGTTLPPAIADPPPLNSVPSRDDQAG